MPTPNQTRVREILEKRHPAFVNVVLGAWTRWLNNPERSQLYRRSQSCLIHNYMMLDAIPNLPKDAGIKAVSRYETAVFLVDDELIVRFKKGDDKGLSSNIGTQAAIAFNDPNENLALFAELPDLGRVDIAYQPNELGTKIQDVLVVARDDSRVLWSYSIHQVAEGTDDPTVLPTAPIEPPPADSGMRVPESQPGEKKADGTT